jgi:hypothetical protein
MVHFVVVKRWHGMPDPTIIDRVTTWDEAVEKAATIPKGEGYNVEIWKYVSEADDTVH